MTQNNFFQNMNKAIILLEFLFYPFVRLQTFRTCTGYFPIFFCWIQITSSVIRVPAWPVFFIGLEYYPLRFRFTGTYRIYGESIPVFDYRTTIPVDTFRQCFVSGDNGFPAEDANVWEKQWYKIVRVISGGYPGLPDG